MKRNNLKTGVTISGFLLILLFVVVAFCFTFCGKYAPTESSSSISEVEELIVEETTTTETSTDVSTETTTYLVDETTITTLIESTTTNEVITETSQEQTTATSQLPITTSAETITETTSSQTTTITTMPATTPALKSIEEIAIEVWQGLWGAGCDRKARLEAAGYDYNEVQKVVDEIGRLKTTESTSTSVVTTTKTETTPSGLQIQFVKTFTRGTYYAYGGPRKGGSGRQLIDCSQGEGGIKGSIASRYLYDNYGYNYNGKRTMVYLEVEGYPQMNGFYYLDDSNAVGHNNVIDFFFLYNSNCPFQYYGVIKVDCSIVK